MSLSKEAQQQNANEVAARMQEFQKVKTAVTADLDNLSTQSDEIMGQIDCINIPFDLKDEGQKFKTNLSKFAHTMKKLCHENYLQLGTLSYAEKARSLKSWMNQVILAMKNLKQTLENLSQDLENLIKECGDLIKRCDDLKEIAENRKRMAKNASTITFWSALVSVVAIGVLGCMHIATFGGSTVALCCITAGYCGAVIGAGFGLGAVSDHYKEKAQRCATASEHLQMTKSQLEAVQQDIEAVKKEYQNACDGVTQVQFMGEANVDDASDEKFWKSREYDTIKNGLEDVRSKLLALEHKSDKLVERAQQINIPQTKQDECFNKGTLVVIQNGNGIENTKIEDVQEDDLILCQDKHGNPVFQPVVIKDAHQAYQGQLFKFLLQDGNEVTVTPGHGMLVNGEIVFAHQVQIGMKFTVYKDDGYSEAEIVDKSELTDHQKEGTTVYNLVTPNFNMVANNILASCKGEDGVKNYPAFAWTLGECLYQIGGAQVARKYYRVFQ